LETGYDFNDVAIPFELELRPVYPLGSDKEVSFDKVVAYVSNGPDIIILYKLLYRPVRGETTWVSDKDWTPLRGNQQGDKTEWHFPMGSRACGVQLKIVETSTNESFLLEKLEIYYDL
jgi:hypothetical protein